MKLRCAPIIAALIGVALSFASASAQDLKTIDATTAVEVLPQAQMSQDVFGDKRTIAIPGWTRLKGDWQAFFKQSQINKIAPSGFYAGVYQDVRGNITIAYRSTK